MTDGSQEPIAPVTGEEFLDRARSRRLGPAPQSKAQIAVGENIVHNVGHYFVPDPGGAPQFVLNPDLHLNDDGTARQISDEPYEIVSWEFVGIHARSFRGIPATGKPVWFRGLTIAEPFDSPSGFTYSQFIDWREVLLQLGVVPEASRPLLASDDIRPQRCLLGTPIVAVRSRRVAFCRCGTAAICGGGVLASMVMI